MMKIFLNLRRSAILFLLLIFSLSSYEQCTGSFGDPVVNITFGAGTNPGPDLSSAVPGASTSYDYTAPQGTPPANSVYDGAYALVNTVPGNGNWFHGHDHTGDPNGYMAFFNASPVPGEFYRQTVSGLCPSTTYEFSAWIVNVINPAKVTDAKNPNVTFNIYDPNNTIEPIASFTTGEIPQFFQMTWQHYSTSFVTPAGVVSLILTLTNNNENGAGTPGGGNDLAIDDITFRACGPLTHASFSASSPVTALHLCSHIAFSVHGISGSGLSAPVFQWEISADNGMTWNDIIGATTPDYNSPALAPGNYKIRMSTQEASTASSAFCRFYSNVIDLSVKAEFFTVDAAICDGGAYAGHTTAGTYTDALIGADGCDSIRTLHLTVKPRSFTTVNAIICEGRSENGYTTSGIYTDTYIAANGCDSIRTLKLTVKPKPMIIASKSNDLDCSNFFSNLHVTGGVTYTWSPVTGLSSSTSPDPVATPPYTTEYGVTGIGLNGCPGTATIKVRKIGPTGPVIFIPNSFSPNGDDKNDCFRVLCDGDMQDFTMIIYNRWSEKIFETHDPLACWDGSYKGKVVTAGSYVYYITTKTSCGDFKQRGNLILIK